MRSLSCVVLLLTLLFLGVFSSAQQAPAASVPNLIRYGGMLKDGQGTALPETTVGVAFAIYNQAEGGASLWSETQNVTVTATGRYSVLLGSSSSTGLPGDLFSPAEPRWLGVKVEGQTERPRVLLVSVPYAMKAAEADTLAGHSASEFVTTDNLQTAVQQQVQQQTNGPSQARTTTVGVSPNQNTSPYINNGTVLQTGADFNIDGTGNAATLNVTGNYNLGGAPVLGNSGTQGMFLGAGAGQNNTGSYNLFLGIAAGHNTTAADYNTFIGTDAGYFNTTGTQNFMLGATAGYHNTTGSYNMFVGSLAGYNNTTGTRNVFVGRAAGSGNTTGTGNSFLGANAGSASTANFNTFLGGFSGAATTTGNNNTFVGWQVGQTNVTGGNNTFVGYNVGSAAGTASNNDVYIASPGAANETGVIRIGDPATQTAAYIAGIYGNAPSGALPVVVNASGQLGTTTAGIGVTSFNGRTGAVLPAAGDYSFSLLSGTLGGSQLSGSYGNAVTLSNTSNVYYGNGSNLTGVVAASGSPYYIQNGTALQAGASFNISGAGWANVFNSGTAYQIRGSSVLSIGNAADNNLFLGVGSGANNVAGSGYSNTFAGASAGSSNTTGVFNTFVGASAGSSNTTGMFNSFYGNAAGSGNTNGTGNTFLGVAVAEVNTTGSYNTFTGYIAGRSNTTGGDNNFFGESAGYSNTTGSNNDFFGSNAGFGNFTGQYNTFIGDSAGVLNHTGNNNVFFGSNAGGNSTTGSQNVYLGVAAGGPPSNIAYDNNVGNNNVAVGYEAGFSSRTGSGNTFVGNLAGYNDFSGSNDVYIANQGPQSGDESNTIRMGDPAVQTAAYIAGIFGATSSGGVAVYINSGGQLGTLTSSRRFKEQVRDMGNSSDALMKLRPVTFLYKPEYDKGPRTLQYGLIAEEVAEVYPDLVAYEPDGKPYTVKYQYLTTMLLNELQKEHRKVEELKAELQVQNGELKRQNEELQQRLAWVEILLQSQMNSVVAQTASAIASQPDGTRK